MRWHRSRYVAVLLLIVLVGAIALPAEASFCRQIGEHNLCIVRIKRSAKNYWEYRASVKIDGMVQPMEIYNCRDRLKIKQDGTTSPFESQGAGRLICHVLKK